MKLRERAKAPTTTRAVPSSLEGWTHQCKLLVVRRTTRSDPWDNLTPSSDTGGQHPWIGPWNWRRPIASS